LEYLHSFDIVHGDIKGVRNPVLGSELTLTQQQKNVLISSQQRAMLSDFGLTSILLDPGNSQADTTMTTAMKGTIPWMAPELLDPMDFGLTHSKSTKHSDMYALGMLILEVRSPP
jgi:serine/threonine protein kinase